MSRNLQILLIDQDVESMISLKRQLNSNGCAVIGEAHFGVEAISLAQINRPEAILLRLDEPVARALQTIEAICTVAPNSPVVVLSHLGTPAYIQKAMEAGARGYLVQPVDTKSIYQALLKAYETAQERPAVDPEPGRMPKAATVISIFSTKGGVGKTTIATNLAISIQKLTEAWVLLIDMDVIFGDSALMMNMLSTLSVADWLQEWETNPEADIKPFVTSFSKNLDVLAARQRVGNEIPANPDAVRALVQQASRKYDYVIIDMPGSLNSGIQAALMESTLVLLVTNTDMASVKDARLCMEMLHSWGLTQDRVKLALNHSNTANGVKPRDIEEVLNDKIFWSIPYDISAIRSSQMGQPLVINNPKSKVSSNFESLGTALTGAKPPRKSWMSNLFGRG
jgi:pilus assembly protein CpaE